MTDETELPEHIALLWGARETARRGPKPALTVREITMAAMAIADAEGLAAVSMAKVAAHLGNSTMALYRYVKSKRELLMLMGDAALSPPPEFPPDVGWREGLETWAKAIFVAVSSHPWFHEIPISAPPFGPHNLMWFDRGLATLGETELSEPEKAGVVMGLLTLLRGEYALRAQLAAGHKEDPTAFGRQYHNALTQLLDPREFPALTKLVAAGVFDEESLWDEEGIDTDFEFSLHLYLDGVATYLERRANPH
ncbi:TetR/AcrR family transcriptional regulator [Kibdelosporangium philippinense]|uniref:TetR/AcrR family transcriptional regulator n=1 Tax=Kibdelosporangium philippinense TaxID=211113 RepID=A0ABS8ZIK9_9PSEU|nr:TetR/AcrR family transcriptional regulator [Kibdelosporangium philippinense]MCE7006288.1 TetR/AcrR family transcriptional regulator [Kibdelosporangium philippinense]